MPAVRYTMQAGTAYFSAFAKRSSEGKSSRRMLTGNVLGDAAAAYIRARLGGKAKVVLLTHDSLQFLAPRFVAMRDALRDIPGATIVADISPRQCTGPINTDSRGGAPAESPQGQTPPGMQSAPEGSSKTIVDEGVRK